MFQLIDNLNKINLRPETKNKLKKIREEAEKDIKDESEKEKKEEVRRFSLLNAFLSVVYVSDAIAIYSGGRSKSSRETPS